MATLLSVNVGRPRDVPFKGEVVRTGVWKAPVTGRVMARRLNIDGDGQGDLGGHGGEQRAVLVYQIQSYRYWEAFLQRPTLAYGSFGENLTVDGLPDDEVCIGDRFRVGDALLEVTQPRVTCYRVGMRMDEPRLPALLVAHKRPGFYCRVIEEGMIGAGDAIRKEASGSGMSVTEIDGLLYLSGHPRASLERAVGIPALSPGWRQSFAALLAEDPATRGNAGLVRVSAEVPAWAGFRDVRVVATHRESPSVKSLVFEAVGDAPLPPARGGQFIVVRMERPAPLAPLVRSYSLSDASTPGRYRISVKRGHGEGSAWLHASVHEGDRLAISAPRGDFVLAAGTRPVVFWSAGIGITPLLGMLRQLVHDGEASGRPVFWIHGDRDGAENVFADEVRVLLAGLGPVKHMLAFSRPLPSDRQGIDFDVRGRLDAGQLGPLGIPSNALFYLCGPTAFMTGARDGLRAAGVAEPDIFSELFGGVEPLRPGIAPSSAIAPHPPTDAASDGPMVSFVRSGLSVHWSERYGSLLELAEACDVPVRWSCRSGVCHNCETAVVDGDVAYSPDPLQPAALGHVLICCSRPKGDLQLDL